MNKDQLYSGTETCGEKFLEFCQPIKQFLDLDNYAYYNVNIYGSMINIHSSRNWIKEYIAGEHYIDDPHIVHPSNMPKGFCIILLDNNYSYQKYNDCLLYEAKNKLLFSYGFTYILKTKTDFTAFCFTTNKNNYIINKIINETKIIELFIQKLDQKMQLLLPTIFPFKIDLPQLKGEKFFKQKGITFPQ